MANKPFPNLLPKGFQDRLTEDISLESEVLNRLMNLFDQFGYERVKPPLLEYEDSFFANGNISLKNSSFRMMDSHTGQMLVLRPDITPQISRIAATALKTQQRPLRLAYNGQVVHLHHDELSGARQFTQVGIEIIDVKPEKRNQANCEAILLAILALEACDISDLIVDITLPQASDSIIEAAMLDPQEEQNLRKALNHKDSSALKDLPSSLRKDLEILLNNAGAASDVLSALEDHHFVYAGAKLIEQIEQCKQLCNTVQNQRPDINLTLDPLEQRGFEYHQNIGFNIYTKSARGALAAGGSYLGCDNSWATGMTVYLEMLRPFLGSVSSRTCYAMPLTNSLKDIQDAQAKGQRCSWDLS